MDRRRYAGRHRSVTLLDLQGRICPLHGIPASAHGGMHYDGAFDPESTWCFADSCPAAVCGGPHDPFDYCPSCGDTKEGTYAFAADCQHPFHTSDPSHQYGNMITREGTGADAGGEADPLVQEPTDG